MIEINWIFDSLPRNAIYFRRYAGSCFQCCRRRQSYQFVSGELNRAQPVDWLWSTGHYGVLKRRRAVPDDSTKWVSGWIRFPFWKLFSPLCILKRISSHIIHRNDSPSPWRLFHLLTVRFKITSIGHCGFNAFCLMYPLPTALKPSIDGGQGCRSFSLPHQHRIIGVASPCGGDQDLRSTPMYVCSRCNSR